MIPVGGIARTARLPRSRLTSTKFVCKNIRCVHEKVGQPGYRDLGFYEHFIPVIRRFRDRTDNT